MIWTIIIGTLIAIFAIFMAVKEQMEQMEK